MQEQIRAWQTILTLLIEYSALVLGTGAFVFRKRLRGRGFLYGVLVSLVMGNILWINLVFAAFALRVYGRRGIVCLWFFLVVGSLLWPIRKKLPDLAENVLETTRKLLAGEFGLRLACKILFRKIWVSLKKFRRLLLNSWFLPHGIEILFVLGLLIFNTWYYSYQAVYFGGIGVSDVSVHTEWVQKMREGNIFGNGIYPFGFHCIVYLMLTVFANEIIPVMVYFAFVQDFFIFLLLYLLMRKAFRFPGTAVAGFFIFSVLGIIGNYRYQFTLPQEYGMIGLYPAVLFLWMYLEQKKIEIRSQRLKPGREDSREARKLVKRLNRKSLLRAGGANELAWYFSFSVALTFMCHFYITIACFFLCAGLAAVYPITLFRRKCLVPLLLTVSLSMSMALAPMVGWYVAGKPLEGSLKWAMNVITGKNEEETDDNQAEPQEEEEQEDEGEENSEDVSGQAGTAGKTGEDSGEETVTLSEQEKLWIEIADDPFPKKIYKVLRKICTGTMEGKKGIYCLWGILTSVAYGSFLLLLKKRRKEGKLILGMSASMLMLLILVRASWFHLPVLMDPGRTAIFLDYLAAFFFACPLDAVTGWFFSIRWFRPLVSLAIYAVNGFLLVQTVDGGIVRNLSVYNMLQYRPALDLAEHIMDEYEDFTWTIVSPVDELPFIRLNGYHYEWLEFLAKQAKFEEKKQLLIPTKYVFFYVEKKPLRYANAVWMSAERPEFEAVSIKDANTVFNEEESFTSGLYGSHRNIIESKVYYWAKTYASYFPREMTVYYEDENFICYRLVQDPYRVNDLIVDFGYNVGTYQSVEEEE